MKHTIRMSWWDRSMVTIAFILALILTVWTAHSVYRWCTDIEYRQGMVVTDLGQCRNTSNTSSQCTARAGDTIVTAKFPMLVGQVVYQRCFIESSGYEYCTNEWDVGRQRNPDVYDARAEYARGL